MEGRTDRVGSSRLQNTSGSSRKVMTVGAEVVAPKALLATTV